MFEIPFKDYFVLMASYSHCLCIQCWPKLVYTRHFNLYVFNSILNCIGNNLLKCSLSWPTELHSLSAIWSLLQFFDLSWKKYKDFLQNIYKQKFPRMTKFHIWSFIPQGKIKTWIIKVKCSYNTYHLRASAEPKLSFLITHMTGFLSPCLTHTHTHT